MSAPRFNINLGLAAVPDIANNDVLEAVLPLYSAARALAGGVDSLTGTAYVDPTDFENQKDSSTVILANTTRIYRKFSEAISAGQTVSLVGELATKGTNGAVVGFSVSDYVAGEWGVIVLMGYWPISGVVAGTVYVAGNTPGTIATLAQIPANQRLGRALSTRGLFFNPHLGP